jgi:hypothetical protein
VRQKINGCVAFFMQFELKLKYRELRYEILISWKYVNGMICWKRYGSPMEILHTRLLKENIPHVFYCPSSLPSPSSRFHFPPLPIP